jgi:hypothetical protein
MTVASFNIVASFNKVANSLRSYLDLPGDQTKFDRLRGVELKHGRVSQLAL